MTSRRAFPKTDQAAAAREVQNGIHSQNISPPFTTTQRPFSTFCTCVTVEAR
jgi:hypothetical protein